MLFPWLPPEVPPHGKQAIRGPHRVLAGTVVPGVPVATIQQEPLSDDAWEKREGW